MAKIHGLWEKLLDPVPQLKYYERINFAPTNSKVKIPDELKANIMPLDQGITPDYRKLIAATPGMVDRWNREIRS